MVQQGRILASAIALAPDYQSLKRQAESIFAALDGRNDARLRIVNPEGTVLADSSLIANTSPPQDKIAEKTAPPLDNPIALAETENTPSRENPQNNIIYRFGVWIARLTRPIFSPSTISPVPSKIINTDNNEEYLKGPEILAAFNGKYAAFTRISSGQKSVTLYSAIPVSRNGKVNEVVLVSRSTLSILSNLYGLRLNFTYIFLLSLLGAVILSILLARTVTVPIGKLRKQAEQILDSRGKLHSPFKALSGPDEVAELSRALNHLSSRLQARSENLERFTADLVHEMKNPIASILSTSELAAQYTIRPIACPPPQPRSSLDKNATHFMNVISKETHRLQNLLDDLQELIKIDTGMENGQLETVNPSQFITNYISTMPRKPNGVTINLTDKLEHKVFILINSERLLQALSNLIDNAVSFSEPGQNVDVTIDRQPEKFLKIHVADRGPGIPENISEKVFERWYTDRPDPKEEKGIKHTGLGLAIVKGIAEANGGQVKLTHRKNGGAIFTLYLPLTSRQKTIQHPQNPTPSS